MSKQVVTKEMVQEARASLIKQQIMPSLDRILAMTGGSKSTVAKYNKEIEEELTESLKLGADLPPKFVATMIDFARKLFLYAIEVAEQRHEEERQQFRLTREAHLADCELLENTRAEALEQLETARLEIANGADRHTAMRLELDAKLQEAAELDAALNKERVQNIALREDLRRLEDYRRVAILLERVETSSKISEPAGASNLHGAPPKEPGGEQLDILTYKMPPTVLVPPVPAE